MNKRLRTPKYMQIITVFALALMLFVSCADSGSQPAGSDANTVDTVALIAPEPTSDEEYILLHGFLDTANSHGIPVRLYTFEYGEDSREYAKLALDDRCAGAVFYGCTQEAVDIFTTAGFPAMMLLEESNAMQDSVLIDDSEYYGDVAEFMLEKLHADGAESGTVLIYGADNANVVTANVKTVFGDEFTAEAYTDGMSMESVRGIYALSDTQGALELAHGTKIVVIGTGITDETTEQFASGLYALCVEPMYEAGAQSLLSIKKLMEGDSDGFTHTETLRRAIVTSSGVNRYVSERYRALLMFEQVTPSPAPTAVVLTDEPTETPGTTEEP